MNIDELKNIKVAKYKCLNSFLFFTRYFFKHRYNRKFLIGQHHELIANAIERVLKGELKRLIINIAPRYGKTELAVKNLIAHGLALNPSAKFIHLTYADTLALDNSEEAKDLVTSPEYQAMFPNVQIKKDSKAKNKWYTTEGGGVYAAAAGGQVTGFGAGKVDNPDEEFEEWLDELGNKQKFAGAIIIDDPIKPDDANSGVKRERVNLRFETTIRNRVNSRETPIIVIGQRLHEHDLSGYLMEVEPDTWEVLSLPVLVDDKPLWPEKHSLEELEKLRAINEYVFETQYQQNPKPLAGLVFPNWQPLPLSKFPLDKPFIGGLDFGYTNDPTAGVKIWVIDKNVWIQELCYTPGLAPVQMLEVFKSAGFNANIPIYCDHDPDMINQLRRLGFRAIPARKGQGSILAGILKMNEYNVYYADTSKNIEFERDRYCYDTDINTGKPLNQPIDGFDHLISAARYGVYTHFFKQ